MKAIQMNKYNFSKILNNLYGSAFALLGIIELFYTNFTNAGIHIAIGNILIAHSIIKNNLVIKFSMIFGSIILLLLLTFFN